MTRSPETDGNVSSPPATAKPAGRGRSGTGQILRWLALAIVVVEAGLVLTGVLELRSALIIALGLELLLAVISLSMAVVMVRHYRRMRADGLPGMDAFCTSLEHVLPHPIGRLMSHEFRVFEGLWLLLRGRDAVPAGAEKFRYGRGLLPMLSILAALSVAEIIVVELLVPWRWVRIALLILTVYGILWIVGLLGAIHRKPHYLTADQAHLRFGHFGDIRVPIAAVADARVATVAGLRKTVQIDDGVAALSVLGSTTVEIRLVPGSEVVVSGTRRGDLTAIRFAADEPSMAAARINALRVSPS
ncbi:hypothetical protein ACTOB_008627 [Actinoplanes oblitus]|uniref:Uncharacterized protein n=1 Tax=Actinoplanes oblitus TaxID=3040509 RepID=A0ABY8WIV4_9ACTN|nr:hypothetical protein [Actinoplanes oblitus]WIM96433.1 hypothetical protein ACTOB_008627 [Actinoplanes oblitus]